MFFLIFLFLFMFLRKKRRCESSPLVSESQRDAVGSLFSLQSKTVNRKERGGKGEHGRQENERERERESER